MVDERLNVLIVEDEQDMRDLIVAFLSTYDVFASIITAKDGSEAINKMSNQSFDIVIIDNILPKKSGLDVINLMKISTFKKTPQIIFMSGSLKSEDVVKAVMLGVKHILVKPFPRSKLIETMKLALQASKNEST